MTVSRAAMIVAAALAATVVTQVLYLALDAGGQSHIAYPIWRIEAVAALGVTAFAFVILPRHPLVGGCLAAGGILNLIQVGMGLTMFYQLGYGGDAPPEPAFFPILNMSFFLYFAAKALFGTAAIVLGATLWRASDTTWRVTGMVAGLAGLAALVLNLAAMILGMSLVYPAGGAGTVATLLLAITLLHPVPDRR